MELFKDIQSGCEAGFYQPLLSHMRAKKTAAPPYIPSCPFAPLHKLCRLALLWNEAGFKTEASQLVHWLLPLKNFLPLWCSEKEYNEKLAQRLFSLLSNIAPVPGGGPDWNLTIAHISAMAAAFTLSGNGTSLGVIRAKKTEIRAFGPQTPSLTFGIQGRGLDGWTRCLALPEVWLEMRTECKETAYKLDFRFVGLAPETPLSFAFYVKAESCRMGGEILKPKSLRRFNGEGKSVQLGSLAIESASLHKMQVIPLAGEGCFWDCEFLVLFDIHPFAPQASFSIKFLDSF